MAKMRAKLVVNAVTKLAQGEILKLNAVGPKGPYPDNGSDENNTYARFSPSASLEIHVMNPELFGQFAPGDEYYVDFTKAPKA